MLRSLPRGLALATASSVTLVAILSLVDCGSAFDLNSINPGADSGSADGGSADGPVFADSGAPAVFKVIAVNASPDLGDVRFCMNAGNLWGSEPIPSDARHPMPASNYPGVPRGAGAVLPTLGNLPRGPIQLYAILASTLARQGTRFKCYELICTAGAGCLTKDSEYYALPPFDATELSGTRLLAITGCAKGTCPQPLQVRTFPLDVTLRSENLGAQVAQLASSLGTTDMAYGSLEAGASPIASGVRFGELQPSVGATAIPLPSQPGDYAREGFILSTTSPDASASRFTFSVTAIQKASDPTMLPSEYFRAKASYVFVVLGDSAEAIPQLTLPDGAANPAYDGRGLHVVAFPTEIARDGGGT